MIKPEIKTLKEKKLIGIHINMSLNNNRTMELWKKFMPRKKEILNNISEDLISMQVYDNGIILGDVNQSFEKWATKEVMTFDNIPEGMETFTLAEGLYAVFNYKGLSTDSSIFIYIFNTWLPNSNYTLDNRPHFEVLGEKYKNGDTNSEEEIWIPIREKNNYYIEKL